MAQTFTIGDQVVICESGQRGQIIYLKWGWAIVEIPDKNRKIVVPTPNISKSLDN